MALTALAGAGDLARTVPAEAACPADFLQADGYLFVAPENLAALSGAMKEMFDRCYYPLLGQIEGRPYASMIAAGSDGQGAQTQLDRIVKGWRLRRVAEPMIVNMAAQTPEQILAEKNVQPEVLVRCGELGSALAHGIEAGIF